MARTPFPVPFGWYQVCWPDEVPEGGAYRTFNLGTTLTVTRVGGVVRATDADGREWPTREVNGLVMMWWHPSRAEPSFDVPALPEFAAFTLID